ncbi:hypothetical protein [Bradyrhizobium canariense]|uniref:SIR2-like domain-containing protein n=1 Tax=Bradyrhizobium canariense TaxID=255045 RepID=A0A1X3EBG9_9BRAD|nr:hypothetical protein [Bradyrhizobium canariense]OSI26580.1 hypothetical protein BST65_12735 [Bradyrhizobium canariense]OSI31521.1 hypothetical protein BST66_19830 [Bradyrhizobium canariense]OSI41458.1 hypothetical protein BSZ20_20640 [Bradyrhizobium canariense]OSI50692.1 hypothetical protein BST67_14515 [Bradyrhizobium canariense]OSI52980.1 hypothetical protein BSZ15_27270 [Bradyrhizobium canariense]
MFKQNVVFVIGAGASREYDFPLGSHLKDEIASATRFRFDHGTSRLSSGSPELLDHIRRHVAGDLSRSNDYTKAANVLAGAIPSFISIDEALHYVSESPEAVEVGKIAIVEQILKAERGSALAFDTRTGRPGQLPDGWIAEFFSMAIAGVQRKELHSIFEHVTFINFNYDRAIEQYLYWALQERASAGANEAKEIVDGLNMLRPYGSIGRFSPNYGDQFAFGTTAHFDPFSRLDALGTYTDQKPMHDLKAMSAALLDAKMILILGFGYHPSNVDVIKVNGFPYNGAIIGSALGVHHTNHSVITGQLTQNLKMTVDTVELTAMKAAELLQQFRPRILRWLQ